MILPLLSILIGVAILAWSADRFVAGAAATARHFNMSPLLIGMLVIGFGTSAPEIAISAIAASSGDTEMALGNAYGSNIANIALILGLTVLMRPVAVDRNVVRLELPLLAVATILAGYQVWDGRLTRFEAVILLSAFALILTWSIRHCSRRRGGAPAGCDAGGQCERAGPLTLALVWVVTGLVLLIVSSRLLVWGASELAGLLGISDLVIGLTVVAVGSSLPELASMIAAVRRGEHDMALGTVLGSNLFNTLVVVGIAVAIQPTIVPPEILYRDIAVMGALTLALFLVCFGYRGKRRVHRFEGAALLSAFGGYSAYLFYGAAG